MDTVLFFMHYTLLLLFGILLTAAFVDLRFSRKNIFMLLGLFAVCGLMQLAALLCFDEMLVWELYPLITHLPIVLLLCIYYRKRIVAVVAAVATAYLCCQPAKWVGIFFAALTGNHVVELIARILALLAVGAALIRYAAPHIAELYQKDTRSVLIFGCIPVVYYLFDYSMGIYTDLWLVNSRVAVEFLPLILCIAFLVFCIVYYREYEKKAEAERKENIIRITVEQQAKEINAVRRSEQEIRMLRHDMRHFVNSLSMCIESDDKEKAAQMIAGFSDHIEGTAVLRYCSNSTVNYILSDFAAKCEEAKVVFSVSVELQALSVDETMFASILSNILENALNAQKELPEAGRCISMSLKTSNGKLLLSVRNPFDTVPIFVDGLPLAGKKGHGYGTQSIRYMTERLGGNCRFAVEGDEFVVRVVL